MGKGIMGYFFGGLVIAFVVWIFAASSGTQRIERGCRPVLWAGNLSVSLIAFVQPEWEAGTHHAFQRTDYMCRYMFWRLFYGDDWNKTHPKDGGGVTAAPTASSTVRP